MRVGTVCCRVGANSVGAKLVEISCKSKEKLLHREDLRFQNRSF
jgi:hypothetical protein